MKKISQIIKEIIKFSQKQPNPKQENLALISNFIENFYSQNQDCDFIDYTTQDLYYLALGSFKFFSYQNFKNPAIQIYNPQISSHNFSFNHTIIDLINKDMHFLYMNIFSSRSVFHLL